MTQARKRFIGISAFIIILTLTYVLLIVGQMKITASEQVRFELPPDSPQAEALNIIQNEIQPRPGHEFWHQRTLDERDLSYQNQQLYGQYQPDCIRTRVTTDRLPIAFGGIRGADLSISDHDANKAKRTGRWLCDCAG